MHCFLNKEVNYENTVFFFTSKYFWKSHIRRYVAQTTSIGNLDKTGN